MSDGSMSLTGVVEPPMANGEVVFEAPWQGRVFALCRGLCEAGFYEWDEFRECLISEISTADDTNYAYFDHFLAAFERLLADKAICLPVELADRFAEFEARPHGHDHHDHSHSHSHSHPHSH